jgi:ligand-binding sensor domain-containing protein
MQKFGATLIMMFWLLCWPQLLLAGGPAFSFTYLTAEDGLTSSRVLCIFRDSKDYVWIGTDNGLNRYDGNQVVAFKHQSDNDHSISNNYINHIAEDSLGNIWIATGNGLNLYSRDDDHFRRFNSITTDPASLGGNHITNLLCDRLGNLWIATRGKDGLNKWLPESGNFKRYHITGNTGDTLVNYAESLAEDLDGHIWLGCQSNMVFSFDPRQETFTAHSSPILDIGGSASSVMIDSDNLVWISNQKTGLYSFNPSTKKFKAFSSNGDGTGTNRKIVFEGIQEDENHLLFAVDEGGINRYNKTTQQFEYITRQEGQPTTLNNNGLWCIHQDREGILWVGTSGGGVNIYNPKARKFKLYKHHDKNPNSLIYNIVAGIYEDSKGLIWLTTNGGGLSIYNRATRQFTNYKNDPGDPHSLPSNVLRCTIEDVHHNFWLGTWDGGLIRFNPTTGRFTQYLPDGQSAFNLQGRNVWHLIFDHKGLMWATIFDEGIDVIDLNKGIVQQFKARPSVKGSLGTTRPQYIFQDSRKHIYVCSDGGLNRFDSIQQNFQMIPFPNNSVNVVFEDAEGLLWAGTQDGLFRFNDEGVILQSYGMGDGLPNTNIIGILEDNHKNLWLSTNNGLSRLNYKTSRVRNYTTEDGLQGRQFEIHACYKTRSGEMFFGGFNGMNSFFPDSVKDNDFLPPVYINEFQLFNKTMKAGMPNSPLEKSIEQTRYIELTRKQAVFSFGFMAINYTHAHKNSYEYMMEGYDTDWIPANSTRRYATYTNLEPGYYTFKVRASNNDGIWNTVPAAISIHIIPPFYGTLSFKIAFLILLLGGVILFIYLREHNLVKQKQALELRVAERTTELQNSNALLKESHQQIKLQNQEILEQHDQILAQKTSLQEQNKRLEVAYKELSTYELQLEATVEERTKELVAAKIKAEESDLLKSSFLANMSHEIRTPLNAIVGFTDLLVNEPHDDDTKQQYKAILNSNTKSLLNLISDILDLSKIESGQLVITKKPTNIGAVLSEINEVHSPRM